MLSITVKTGQSFLVGIATIHIVSRRGNSIKIGIEAPRWLKVWRAISGHEKAR